MSRLLLVIFILSMCIQPAFALEAPDVPDVGKQYMPDTTQSFASGLLSILQKALRIIRPDMYAAIRIGIGCIGTALLVSVLSVISDKCTQSACFLGAVSITAVLLQSTGSMIRLGVDVIRELTEYNKLLLPVMTTALAAQGGVTTSTALFIGTTAFSAFLSTALSQVAVPALYLYIAVSAANCALEDDMLKKLRDQMKIVLSWFLKTVVTVFLSYMSVTGVVSGSADAAAVKAAKAALSTAVPVVGGTLANASESILAGAALVKNAAGIYGIYAILAVFLAPFLKIGCHYLILKTSSSICAMMDPKGVSGLVADFSSAMGMVLGMVGSICLLQLISLFCFLKGGV